MFPGNVGGVNWGSAAYDPSHHIMVANTNRLIAWVKLIPRDQYQGGEQEAAGQPYLWRIRRTEGRALRALSHLPVFSEQVALQRTAVGHHRGR